jgi:hypothetical protein
MQLSLAFAFGQKHITTLNNYSDNLQATDGGLANVRHTHFQERQLGVGITHSRL